MAAIDLYKINGPGTVVDIGRDPEYWVRLKGILKSWFTGITDGFTFRSWHYSSHSAHLSREDTELMLQYVIKCSMELLDAVAETLGNKINTSTLQAMGAACFIIALKLLLGYDLLDERGLYRLVKGAAGDASMMNYLHEYEIDIMERTDWKGCVTSGMSEWDIFLGSRRRSRSRGRRSRRSRSRRHSGSRRKY